MYSSMLSVVIGAAIVSSAPAAKPVLPFTEADVQAIHRTRAVRSTALASRDATAAAAIAVKDHVMMPPMAPILRGQDALREYFGGFRLKSLEFTSLDLQGSGDLAYDRGAYVLTPVEGAAVRGKYLWIWRREADASWRVSTAMWSPDEKQPAEAQPLTKGSLVGVHNAAVKLNPGVTMEQFVAFYNTKLIAAYEKSRPGWRAYPVKRVRGEKADGMGLIIVIPTEQERDKYYKPDGSDSELGVAANGQLEAVLAEMGKLATITADPYIDWVVY